MYIEMNIQMIQNFVNKIKQQGIDLDREITGSTVFSKEAIAKIKEMRTTLTHLHNLLKIEESLENQKDN